MKSIKVYAKDEIIDDIKATAHKLQMSASRYMILFHIMKQEEKYPGEIRGSNVAKEILIQDNGDDQDRPIGGRVWIEPEKGSPWSGGFSKAKQTGKK